MAQFIEFVGNHWMLAGLWVLFLVALILYLNNKKGKACSIHEATSLVNKQNGIFLDIRDRGEFDKGHITNALNIPLAKLKNSLQELDKYKTDPIIVVCNLGHQSGDGVKALQAEGFEQPVRMSGGMTEWRSQGLPVVAG